MQHEPFETELTKKRKEDVYMLNIHSFLQRMKAYLCNCLSRKKELSESNPVQGDKDIESYKNQIAVIFYSMAAILILISSRYLCSVIGIGQTAFGQKTISGWLVKAEELPENPTANTDNNSNEETANTAIIRVTKNPVLMNDNQTIQMSDGTYKASLVFMGEMIKDSSETEADITETDVKENDINKNDIKDKDVEDKEKAQKKTSAAASEKEAGKKKTKEKKADSSSAEKDKKTEKKYAISLSKGEIEVLQRIVEAEATGEDIKGKMLVANVIINRTKNKNFPNTVKEVVFQKDGGTYQFSPIKDKRYWSVTISKDTITAVDRVLQGEDDSQGALYFSARKRANKNSMSWFDRNLKYLFKHGAHEFFKDK